LEPVAYVAAHPLGSRPLRPSTATPPLGGRERRWWSSRIFDCGWALFGNCAAENGGELTVYTKHQELKQAGKHCTNRALPRVE
jgi:hypothetical protein